MRGNVPILGVILRSAFGMLCFGLCSEGFVGGRLFLTGPRET